MTEKDRYAKDQLRIAARDIYTNADYDDSDPLTTARQMEQTGRMWREKLEAERKESEAAHA